jgi:DNA-binding SARP family transcriptional activator
MSVSLTIHLFGAFRVQQGHRPLVTFPTQNCKALFAYLVLNRDRPHSRDQLLGIFWGERAEPTARKCLRTDLWRLRHLLEPPGTRPGTYLTLRDHCVRFNALGPHTLDVEEFEDRVQAVDRPGHRLTHAESQLLREAVKLYRGDLLDGLYHDWCVYERERFRLKFRTALERLMSFYKEHEDWTEAIGCAQRLLATEPLLEHVHRDLMRFHYAVGDRPSALQQFRECARLLQQELQIGPMPETLTLHDEILAGTMLRAEPGTPTAPSPVSTLDPVDRVLDNLFTLDTELGAARVVVRWGINEMKRTRRPATRSKDRL